MYRIVGRPLIPEHVARRERRGRCSLLIKHNHVSGENALQPVRALISGVIDARVMLSMGRG